MRWKTGIRYSALTLVLVAAGCNLFNPSGAGDGGDTNPRAEGDIYLQRGEFAHAMAAFERAIKKDSTDSRAYYGYAQSASRLFKLSNTAVLQDLIDTRDGASFAFLDHDSVVLTQRLQAASRVRRVLERLTDRDTLTQWYNYLKDTVTVGDSLYLVRRNFMADYILKADLQTIGYRAKNKFPLTDFEMPASRAMAELTAFKLLYTVTRLYDLDQNDTIDHRDALMRKLHFGKDGGFRIDSLGAIADDLETNPAQAENLNALIAGMQSGVVETSQLALLIGGGSSSDSGASGENSGNVDSVVASMGDAIMFYQFGDGKDNDGDGCIDEEFMDDLDNDDDGFIDEDARVLKNPQAEGRDNDRNGIGAFVGLTGTVDAGEDTVGVGVNPTHPKWLGFVQNYYAAAANHPESLWVKIRKGNDFEMPLRIKIQKDSLATKSKAQLQGPLKQKLDSAKALMGGCWRNYPTHVP